MIMNAILGKLKRPFTLCLTVAASFMLVCVLSLPAYSAMVWKAKINVEAVGMSDTGAAILGAATDATDGFENAYEARALLSGYLMAYFRHPEWGQETQFFWTDIRDTTLPKEWSWIVQSRYRNRDHIVSWEIDVPENLELYMMDTVTGDVIDMRAASTYTYRNTSMAAREFVIEATGEIGGQMPQDTTPPETTITSASEGYTGATSFTFVYSGSDDVSGASSLEYSYSFDGGTWSPFDMDTTVTLSPSSIGSGEHIFRVKAKDLAGNEDPTPAERTFTVDLTPPVLLLSSVSPEQLWPPNRRMKNVTFTGTITDALSGVSSLTYAVVDEYGEIGTTGAVSTAGGSFTFVVELMAMRHGRDRDGRLYTISLTGLDNAGNSVTTSGDVLVPRDRRGIKKDKKKHDKKDAKKDKEKDDDEDDDEDDDDKEDKVDEKDKEDKKSDKRHRDRNRYRGR